MEVQHRQLGRQTSSKKGDGSSWSLTNAVPCADSDGISPSNSQGGQGVLTKHGLSLTGVVVDLGLEIDHIPSYWGASAISWV